MSRPRIVHTVFPIWFGRVLIVRLPLFIDRGALVCLAKIIAQPFAGSEDTLPEGRESLGFVEIGFLRELGDL